LIAYCKKNCKEIIKIQHIIDSEIQIELNMKIRNRSRNTKQHSRAKAEPDKDMWVALKENTGIFGEYGPVPSLAEVAEAEKTVGKFARENQLASAAAGTGRKARHYLEVALGCSNAKLINPTSLCVDPKTNEVRINELTSLMIACIMGKMSTVRHLVQEAKQRLKPSQFKSFINIKVTKNMGGNNALLYACNSSGSNYTIVQYLVTEAGADQDSMNDHSLSCLLIATKKARLDIIELLLQNGSDIGQVDRKGRNALHIAAATGYSDIVQMILLCWRKDCQRRKKLLKNADSMSEECGRQLLAMTEFSIDCPDNS